MIVPANKVLFRASSAGDLMVGMKKVSATEELLLKIKELENERDFGVNANGNKVKWLGTKKPDDLAKLIARRDAPPQLSDTAKAFIRRVWLENNKKFKKQIKSKYLEKGLYREEDAISLLTEIDGVFYTKNEERKENEDHTGECDIVKEINGVRIVQDTKCSYDPETFMNAGEDDLYIWQGRIYMELFDCEEFWLRYCLVDAPEHLVSKEKEFARRKYMDDSMSVQEMNRVEEMIQPILEQIDFNMVYSTNPLYTKEERVKTFKYRRDKSKMAEMAQAVKLAREYYSTLTLNGPI